MGRGTYFGGNTLVPWNWMSRPQLSAQAQKLRTKQMARDKAKQKKAVELANLEKIREEAEQRAQKEAHKRG